MENLLGILGKIGFDWQVALANLVNFLIILFILKKFAFKPIKKIIEDRQKKIEEGLENTKKTEAELMVAGIQKEEILREAKDAGGLILNDAMRDKNEIMERAKLRAQEEAALIIESAEKQKENELLAFQRKMEEEAGALVIEVSEKLLKEKVGTAENELFVKSLLKSSSTK